MTNKSRRTTTTYICEVFLIIITIFVLFGSSTVVEASQDNTIELHGNQVLITQNFNDNSKSGCTCTYDIIFGKIVIHCYPKIEYPLVFFPRHPNISRLDDN